MFFDDILDRAETYRYTMMRKHGDDVEKVRNAVNRKFKKELENRWKQILN